MNGFIEVDSLVGEVMRRPDRMRRAIRVDKIVSISESSGGGHCYINVDGKLDEVWHSYDDVKKKIKDALDIFN